MALLGLAVLVCALVAFYAWRKGLVTAALDLAVQPRMLIGLLIALVIATLAWCIGIVLTAVETNPHGRGERWRSVFAGVCCLVVILPAATAVQYLMTQADLVNAITAHVKTPGAKPAVSAWDDQPRVNMLLLGSDSGDDRVGVRTDSMMVASIDTKSGDTVLFGLPRNLERAPIPTSNPLHERFPNGYDCGRECLLNGVWTLATDNKDLFPGDPNPGLRTTRDVIGEILGLDIDRTLVVDLKGFQSLVDAMGGVEINVKQRVCTGCKQLPSGRIVFANDEERWIEPGPQRLNGYNALWYARSRAGSDDFSRMRRQRCVTGAILKQAQPAELLRNYPALAKVIKNNVRVDIPTEELPAWAELVGTVQSKGSVRSLPITNEVVNVARPDYDKIREMVQEAIDPPAPKESPSESASKDSSSDSGTSSTPSGEKSDTDSNQNSDNDSKDSSDSDSSSSSDGSSTSEPSPSESDSDKATDLAATC